MKELIQKTMPKPVSSKKIIRFLIVVIIILTYLAGYYHSLWQLEVKKSSYNQALKVSF